MATQHSPAEHLGAINDFITVTGAITAEQFTYLSALIGFPCQPAA